MSAIGADIFSCLLNNSPADVSYPTPHAVTFNERLCSPRQTIIARDVTHHQRRASVHNGGARCPSGTEGVTAIPLAGSGDDVGSRVKF